MDFPEQLLLFHPWGVSKAGLDRAWNNLGWWKVSLPCRGWHWLSFKVPLQSQPFHNSLISGRQTSMRNSRGLCAVATALLGSPGMQALPGLALSCQGRTGRRGRRRCPSPAGSFSPLQGAQSVAGEFSGWNCKHRSCSRAL